MKIIVVDQNYFSENKNNIIKQWFRIWDDTPWANFKLNTKIVENYFKKAISEGILLILMEKNIIVGYLVAFYNSHQETKTRENKCQKLLFEELVNKYGNYVYLADIVLNNKHRGAQLGCKLYAKFENIVKSKKFRLIVLYTELESMSHNFYQKLLFKKCGEINRMQRPDISRGYEDRVYYIKELSY